MRRTLALAAALALGAGAALATSHLHSGHGAGHAGHGAAAADDTEATRAYRAANERMHRGMDIAFTGDADADFARGMIPHHRGAIDMARVVLDHGTDPELRRLAEEIIAAQEAEIAFLEGWLKAKGY